MSFQYQPLHRQASSTTGWCQGGTHETHAHNCRTIAGSWDRRRAGANAGWCIAEFRGSVLLRSCRDRAAVLPSILEPALLSVPPCTCDRRSSPLLSPARRCRPAAPLPRAPVSSPPVSSRLVAPSMSGLRRLGAAGLVVLVTGCIPRFAPAPSVPAPLPRARTTVPVEGAGNELSVSQVIEVLRGCAPIWCSADSVAVKHRCGCAPRTPPTVLPK